jgi:Na+-transporting NADH:ubiquinone oxidoreductase subunit E
MTAPDVAAFSLFFGSILTSNILLSNFLGMCSFISISKDIKSSNGLGIAVTLVLVLTAVINWVLLYFVIIPLGIEYLSLVVFIISIAAAVQVVEMVIERVSPPLYLSLGIFLPLITVNCAILGGVLFMQIRSYNLLQTAVFALGSGLGWWMAIMALAAIRLKVEKAPVPAGLKGTGITMITIGMMAMGFIGFSGMIRVQ